jgi:PadR family transcriptional regulator, regulatory protein PadR
VSHEPIDMPQGTVDLLILKIVALGPRHGWSIAERLHQLSSAALCIKQGSLYPALHRLERRGWLKATWGPSDTNRRAKYYALTRKGRAQLETEASAWRKLAAAVSQILEVG